MIRNRRPVGTTFALLLLLALAVSPVALKPLREVTQEALHVLFREIGIANTIRFLNQSSLGQGSYTEEREELFGELSLDEAVKAIRDRRGD